jgi:hypothetical protein
MYVLQVSFKLSRSLVPNDHEDDEGGDGDGGDDDGCDGDDGDDDSKKMQHTKIAFMIVESSAVRLFGMNGMVWPAKAE